MTTRCASQRDWDKSKYFDKGIRVCEEWKDFAVFRDWAEKAGYRLGLTIDRIDSDGHYSPDNCQWLTRADNSRKVRTDREFKTAALRARVAELEAALATTTGA
jgi:hypothetical protein